MISVNITTIEDLVAFVAIIRGKDLNEEDIKNLTATIDKDTTLLKKAVEEQGEKNA